jgi:hypothetical protein|tara:strand:+ start:78 stop:269 length:192 start_codon:yes stop_codon:yes gene_type:complete
MPTPRGVSPSQYLIERFEKFLSNDWIHLERRVATIDGKLQVLLGLMTVLCGLVTWVVVLAVID